jgi:hypothetical protein
MVAMLSWSEVVIACVTAVVMALGFYVLARRGCGT